MQNCNMFNLTVASSMIEWNFLDYNPVLNIAISDENIQKGHLSLVLLYILKSHVHFYFSIKTLESEATWRTVDSDQMKMSKSQLI